MIEVIPVRQSATVFEKEWDQPTGHLFKSERHGVMAVADAFPRFNFQVVIAPKDGNPGQPVHFAELPRPTRRKLYEVSDAVEEKMLELCLPGQRVITHIEGFGVPDHAHMVKFVAERKEGQNLYIGRLIGERALQNTIELMTFTPEEASLLEVRLNDIR